MAEVRCPMCGKANPADAEVCAYCSARLKPLNLSSSGSDSGVPDWLRDLRGKDSEQPPAASPFGEGSLSESDEKPAGPFGGESGGQADDGEVPDWLARIRERASQGDEEAVPGEQGADWLDSLRAGGDSLSEPGETAAAEDGVSLFGAGLDGGFAPDESETGAEELPAAPGDALPDWLAQLGGETGGSDTPALESSPPGERDDWLTNLQGASFESPADETPAAQTAGEDLPDWLSQIGGAPAEETPAAGSDFHFDFEDTPAASESALTAGEDATGASEMPDWLAGLSQPEDTPAGGDAAPDWLNATGADEIHPQATCADDLPAWLQGGEPEAESDSLQPGGPIGEEIPAWLQSDQPLPLDETQPAGDFQADLPDWLSADAATPTGESDAPLEQPGDAGLTAWGERVPDWLSDVQPEEGLSQTLPFDESALAGLEGGAGEEEEAIPAAREDMPDWLSRLNEQPGAGGVPGEGEIFTRQPIGDQTPQPGESMPDWLARMGPPDETPQPAVTGEETPGGRDEEITLTPADLPNWVQAMRPIESAAPLETTISQEVDERIEKAGPLAGLKGIIPAEPGMGGLRKPPVYSVKLHTTEKQRADIELLESVVATEAQPRALPAKGTVSSQSLLRWVIALVLLLAVAVPLWLQSNLMAVPGVVAPELAALNRAVAALPEGATVLLAVEYEPGLAGEMEAAASSLVTHLMTRSANLVLFSTNPTGPVLGERLLANAHRVQPGLTGGSSANLGYLPGGPAALLNFALNPRGATSSARGVQAAWSQPYLQTVATAADFSAVILLTENADTARAWIEQVSPTLILGQKPMFVVSSAQSAPMISPYVDSGQFQGMLVGLAGGASYEQLRQYPATASAYWDAYQVGVLVLIVLILIGGLYALGQELIRQSRQNSGDAS